MSKLSDKQRDKLPEREFAYIDKDGEGHLPINDEEHVRNAIARWNQTHFENAGAKENARKKILKAAKRYGIEVSEDDNIRKAA